jgi:hypothetical protein
MNTFNQIAGDEKNKEKKEENDKQDKIRDKIKKANLKKFLQERYTAKVASRICSLFDWNNPIGHEEFFKHINEVFICSNHDPIHDKTDKNEK